MSRHLRVGPADAAAGTEDFAPVAVLPPHTSGPGTEPPGPAKNGRSPRDPQEPPPPTPESDFTSDRKRRQQPERRLLKTARWAEPVGGQSESASRGAGPMAAAPSPLGAPRSSPARWAEPRRVRQSEAAPLRGEPIGLARGGGESPGSAVNPEAGRGEHVVRAMGIGGKINRPRTVNWGRSGGGWGARSPRGGPR